MTRIIAGAFGGRSVKVPPRGTRPTTDRVREALFSTLNSRIDGDWSRVELFLDAYAGSGAVGLEAASRGAKRVVLVESARPALAVLRENVAVLGANVVVEANPVESLGISAPATIAYFDPPYDLDDDALAKVLAHLVRQGWLEHDTLVVLERSVRNSRNLLDDQAEQRTYGETVLWYGHINEGVNA